MQFLITEKKNILRWTFLKLGDALNEVAKIRAQLEKSEAVRHSTEYEMTKLMRDLNNEKRANADKEKVLTELNENMQSIRHFI